MGVTSLPLFQQRIDHRFIIERLGGPQHPRSYLDRFPVEVYNTSPDSHLFRFLYSMLGPSGIGWLHKNYLDARLLIEEAGFDLFDIEGFFAEPLKFGRIVEELYDEDPSGVLAPEQWQRIRAKDTQFRNRALDFFNAARAGTSPEGMRLAARAGLAHEVEIIETYKAMFDRHADKRLFLKEWGQTNQVTEFVVLPRQDISRSEAQSIRMFGQDDANPISGTFLISFNGSLSEPLPAEATAAEVQAALDALPSIGVGNTLVTGGPLPDRSIEILFQGDLGSRDVPQINTISQLTGGVSPAISTVTVTGGVEPTEEVVKLPPRIVHNLQAALDRVRPVTAIPTIAASPGARQRTTFSSVFASSSYTEVLRYVEGQDNVVWPSSFDNPAFWIVGGEERQAPRVRQDLQHHYVGFHNVITVRAYKDTALAEPTYAADVTVTDQHKSEHVGPFSPAQRQVFPYLKDYDETLTLIQTPDRVTADYSEPLTVTTQTATATSTSTQSLINGIYPTQYADLGGVPTIRYKDEQFWASAERTEGAEYLEIDLGSAKAVNYLSLEVARKPMTISVDYEILGRNGQRKWQTVTPEDGFDFTTRLSFEPNQSNPWENLQYTFTDTLGRIPFTRYLRIGLTRLGSTEDPFLVDANNTPQPWSIEARNLRVGRNAV